MSQILAGTQPFILQEKKKIKGEQKNTEQVSHISFSYILLVILSLASTSFSVDPLKLEFTQQGPLSIPILSLGLEAC